MCLAYIDHIIKLGVKQRSRHGSFIGRSLVLLLFAAPIPTGILFVKVFALVVTRNTQTVLGKFETTITFQKNNHLFVIHVLQGGHDSLLSYKTTQALGVINIHVNKVADEAPKHEQLLQQYPELFKGIGKLKGAEVKLHIDQTVTPVAQPARRIPFHLRKKVEKELENVESHELFTS